MSIASAAALIDWAQSALDARHPWREVLEKLAPIVPEQLQPALKARLLLARGIAHNRRGDAQTALRNLIEAQATFADLDNREGLADAARELGVVHAWRGAGRDAGFAFVRALAEAASADSRPQTVRAIVEAARANVEIGRPQEAVALLRLALEAPDDLAPPERGRAAVMLIKALNDDGQQAAAEQHLQSLDRANLRPREALLAQIEGIRVLLPHGHSPEVEHRLEALAAALPEDPNAFEHAEYLAILCEVRLAAGDGAAALTAVEQLIPKVEGDDLGAPLVAALGQKARALDILGRPDQAADAAAGALRRAAERQLQREADAMRESLVLRGEAARALLGLAKGRIDSRFVRSALVGEDGFGKVIRAFDRETGDEVALKQFRTSKINDTELRKCVFDSAESEVEAAKRIDHGGVARVIGLFYEVEGDVFVASAFVRGRTLRQLMNDGNASVAWPAIVMQLADALAAVHARGIAHGDVKPENIILNDEQDGKPVLVDFGSAAFSTHRRRFGAATFTPAYAAPEQKRTLFRRVGPPADLFALGGVAFELICGERLPPASPYPLDPGFAGRGRIARSLRVSGASPEQAHLIARCLSPWSALRPAAAEVAKALSGVPDR